jgi:hypothetical protein
MFSLQKLTWAWHDGYTSYPDLTIAQCGHVCKHHMVLINMYNYVSIKIKMVKRNCGK